MEKEAAPSIRTEHSLLLVDIREPRNNDLRLTIIEALPGPELVETQLGPATPIRPAQTSRGFEITWYMYVAYAVRNESYFRREDGEPLMSTERIEVKKKTAFLDYVAATTIATDDHPGPLTHWAIYTEWHCIDVVGVDPPEVRQLSPSEIAGYLSGDSFDGLFQK